MILGPRKVETATLCHEDKDNPRQKNIYDTNKQKIAKDTDFNRNISWPLV